MRWTGNRIKAEFEIGTERLQLVGQIAAVDLKPPGQLKVLPDQRPGHLEHAFHSLVQIKHPRRYGQLAGNSRQLAGNDH